MNANKKKSVIFLKMAIVFFILLIPFQTKAQRSAAGFSMKSKSFLDQKKFKEALLYADSAVAYSKELGNADTLAQSYRWRFGVRTEMLDYKNALEDYMFSEEYTSQSKSDEALKQKKESDGLLLVEQEAHRKDNILFNARINELQQSTEREQRNRVMAATSLIALTVLSIYLFFRKRNELKGFTEQASDEVKELRLSRDRILTALGSRLKELRLMVEDLDQSFALQGKSSSIDRQSPSENTAAVKRGVDDIINWLSAGQDSASFHPVIFDCKELTELTLTRFERQVAEKKIKTNVFMSEGQLVFADRQMIATVLENLISNAIKFTPDSGDISFFSGVSNDIVSIGVKDSGIGMNQETVGKAFDQDEPVNGHRGLGLILCKDLIERNGGRMYAESVEGKGSTFYFTLPGRTGSS